MLRERVEHVNAEFPMYIARSITLPVLNFKVGKVISLRNGKRSAGPPSSAIPRNKHVLGGVKARNFTILRRKSQLRESLRAFVTLARAREILQNEMRKI